MSESMMEWSIRDSKEQIVPGSIMMDGWELKKLLGKGTFGDVWLAEKTMFGITDQSAIKIIRIPRDPEDIDAMRAEGVSEDSIRTELRRNAENAVREIRAMLDLQSHPAIVPNKNFDVIQYEKDESWEIDIRMQLLTSLPDWIKTKGATAEDVIRMGVSLSDLLIVCEKENILHRDIKPANIFVDKLNNFKLGDFGLARVISDSSSVHSKGVGTEAFMAPEVFNGGQYDHRADIYSLGLVMYWLLNGQSLPFINKSTSRSEAVAKRLAGETLPALPGVDPALDRIVRKACEADPQKRWKNAKEFQDALVNLGAGMREPKPPKSPKKHLLFAATAALVCVVAVFAIVRSANGPATDGNTTIPTKPAETVTPSAIITENSTGTSEPEITPAADTGSSAEISWKEESAAVPTKEPLQRKGYAITIGDGILLRERPASSSSIKTELPANKIVYVTGQQYEENTAWSFIETDSDYGYIRADMLRMITDEELKAYEKLIESIKTPDPQATIAPYVYDPDDMSCYGYVTEDTVNFRTEPSSSSVRILQMKKYALLTVYGTVEANGETWYKVSYNNQDGYVNSKYFKQMTVGETEEFLKSTKYQEGIIRNTQTSNSTSNSGSSSLTMNSAISAEDRRVQEWVNPATGSTVSYEPFDPFATPEASTEDSMEAPTEEPTSPPTEAPTEEPSESPTEAQTEEPAAEPTETSAPVIFTDEVQNCYGKTNMNVYFRKGPSTSAGKLDVLMKNTYVYMIYTKENDSGELWTCAMVNGKTGYIMTEYLDALTEEDSAAYDHAQKTQAPTFTEEDAENVDARIATEEEAARLAAEEEAARRAAEEETIWEPTWEPTCEPTTESEQKSLLVKASELPVNEVINRYGRTGTRVNYRMMPDLHANKYGELFKGTVIYLIYNIKNEEGDLWSYVMAEGHTGWVMSQYIDVLSQEESDAYDSSQPSPAPVYSMEDLLSADSILTGG